MNQYQEKANRQTKRIRNIILISIPAILIFLVLVVGTNSGNKGKRSSGTQADSIQAIQDSIAARAADSIRTANEAERAKLEADHEKSWQTIKSKLHPDRDDFNGRTWYQSKSSPRYRNRNGFFLYFGITDAGSLNTPNFVFQYHADDWLFVQNVQVKCDDLAFTFTPRQRTKRDNSGGKIWEWFQYSASDVTLNQLKKIAESKAATMRINGQQYYRDKTITAKQKAALREILNAWSHLQERGDQEYTYKL
jgi:hypothetical protein